MADETIIAPRRGEFFTPDGMPTHRFISWIENLTTNTNTSTEIIEEIVSEDTATEGDTSRLLAIIARLDKRVVGLEENNDFDTSKLLALIARLEKRVVELEENNDFDTLSAKVARLNQKMNKLINELISAVEAIAPDKEQEAEKVIIAEQQLKELALLNARIEEAFETKIFEEDIE